VPLHPAIKAAFSEYTAAASLNASSTTAGVAGYAGATGGAVTPTTTTPTTTPPSLNNITINTTNTTYTANVTNAANVTNTTNVNINIPTAQTLYDCVPVDRERVYLAQCASNHKKVYADLFVCICLLIASLAVGSFLCKFLQLKATFYSVPIFNTSD